MSAVLRLPFAELLWWCASAAFLLAFAAMWAVSVIDTRLLDGANVWAKPMKFALAVSVHLATLALATYCLSPDWRGSLLLSGLAVITVAAAAGEVGYIAFQAARLEASHFKVDTPFHAAMYMLMAVGAVVLVVGSGGVGLVAALDGRSTFSGPVRLAVSIGLIAGSLLTLITAFRLGGNMSHHVGIEPPDAVRMPLTGWSLSVGDLRPSHFFATHMMQAVPVFGVMAARLLPSTIAVIAVLLFSAAWILTTLMLFSLALGGRPFTDLR